jgi:hypothetical protein
MHTLKFCLLVLLSLMGQTLIPLHYIHEQYWKILVDAFFAIFFFLGAVKVWHLRYNRRDL